MRRESGGRAMGLTSVTFILLLGVAAAALCGLTLWLLPRLAAATARAVLGRIGLLLCSQLSVLLVMAAVMNAAFGFYTSWSSLLGTGSQHYNLTSVGPVAASADADQLAGTKTVHDGSKGVAVTTDLTGLRSGLTAQLHILLPAQYAMPKFRTTDFPAIVIDATGEGYAQSVFNTLEDQPKPLPAILIVVSNVGSTPLSCVNTPGGAQGELFWGQDLRTAVAAKYRVNVAAADWGFFADGVDMDCPVALGLGDAGRYSAAAVLGHWRAPDQPGTALDAPWFLHAFPAPPSRLLFVDLGEPLSKALPDVR